MPSRAAGQFGVCERRLDRWVTWTNIFPPNEGAPGCLDPNERVEPTVGSYVVQLLHLAESAIRSILHPVPAGRRRVRARRAATLGRATAASPPPASVRAEVPPTPVSAAQLIGAASRRVQQAADLLDDLELGALVAATELANTIDNVLDWMGPSGETVVRLVDGFVDALEDRLVTELQETEQGLRALELVDLAVTAVRGLVRDG